MSAIDTLLSLREDRPWFVVLCFLTVATLAVFPFVDWWLRSQGLIGGFRYFDFGAYRVALNRWQAGESFYRRSDGGFHGTFLYPPIVLLLFLPFESFSHSTAGAVWDVLSLGLLWIGLQGVVRTVGYGLDWWERAGLLWLLAGFHPLLVSMKLGQMAPFLGGLLCVGFVTLTRGEAGSRSGRVLSGSLTAVVGVIKLSYAPVGAHLLRDRVRFFAALVTGLCLAGVSVLLFGIQPHRTYLEVLAWGIGRGTGSRPPTLWLPPYYRPLHWLPGAQLVRGLAVAGVIGAVVRGRPADHRIVFALGLTAFPLLTPLPYTYYFVALLPAVIILLAEEHRRDGRRWVPVLGLLLVHLHAYGLKFMVDVLPTVFPPMRILSPYPIFQPGLWGNLLLFGVAFHRTIEDNAVLDWVSSG